MFKFKAKFLVTAEDDNSHDKGFYELNGFPVESLEAFMKQGSSHTAAEDGEDEDSELDSDHKYKSKDDLLGAKHRIVPDSEMKEYLDRVRTRDKTKKDRFDMPYVHNDSIKYVDDGKGKKDKAKPKDKKNDDDAPKKKTKKEKEEARKAKILDTNGKEFDLEALKSAIKRRPTYLLKVNEKMRHSNGSLEQFYNIGLPALRGLIVNEKTNEFAVINTCPGAGVCKVYCYAMRGGYVQFDGSSMMASQTLSYLVNNPKSFENRLKAEINMAMVKNEESGASMAIRWHDAGDFFSPTYFELACRVARAFPDVKFYAYTKVGAIANSDKPDNFIISFSEGALPSETKLVNIGEKKHATVVPKELFIDLAVTAKNGIPLKDEYGQTKLKSPKMWEVLKDRIAEKYKLKRSNVLTYNEYMKKLSENTLGDAPNKWNVIVPVGAGDNATADERVHGVYLLFH